MSEISQAVVDNERGVEPSTSVSGTPSARGRQARTAFGGMEKGRIVPPEKGETTSSPSNL